MKGATGVTDLSARSEITAPQGSGFAVLNIEYRTVDTASAKPDCKCVLVPVSVRLTVESPKKLPQFPFEKYDGPVDKTKNEFIRFEIAPANQSRIRTVKVMPNGGYVDFPQEAFAFDTIDKSVVSFLLAAKDKQKVSVMMNGPPKLHRGCL